MKVTAYVSHHDCSRHDPGWGQPEHQGRLPAVARATYRDMLTLFEPLLELEGVPATEADLRLVHTQDYVERVREACAEAARAGEAVELAPDVRVSGASWEAATAAVGCAMTAVESVLAGDVRNAFCATRPPGAGAGADFASRFSVFNPVAVAARLLRERRGLERVLVVELGAEPGVGTLHALRNVSGVRILSIHHGSQREEVDNSLRVGLPAGASGAQLHSALDEALDLVLDDFIPDFLLLSLGCDALRTDPLGSLALEPDDYYTLSASLRARADRICAGRIVSVLEGGYDPAGMARAVVQHLRALAGLPPA